MSKASNVIIVSPPLFLDRNDKESEEIKGFCCPVCFGNGWVRSSSMRDKSTTKCPFCRGTGKVKATIRTTWSADE